MTADIMTAAPAPKRRTPRWLWALLILSLALNLLIIGIIGGSLWAVRRGGYWDAPLFMERTHRFMRGLPDERRAQVRAIFAQYQPQLQPYWRDVRAARVRIGQLVERGYTPEEFEAALNDLFAKEAKAREASRPMIAAMINALRPNERRLFLSVYMPYLSELQGRPEFEQSAVAAGSSGEFSEYIKEQTLLASPGSPARVWVVCASGEGREGRPSGRR